MEYLTLKVNKNKQGVLHLVLNCPKAKNALNQRMIEELHGQFFKIRQDFGAQNQESKDLKGVVLEGNGEFFCSGGDLDWMKSAKNLSFSENLNQTQKLAELFFLIQNCPVPVLGCVKGGAFGGGAGLISVCDVVLAHKASIFSFSEVKLGLVPACIMPFVKAKIGISWTRALFLSACRFDSSLAEKIGLIHFRVENEEQWIKKKEELTESFLTSGRSALIKTKQLLLSKGPNEAKQDAQLTYDLAKILAETRISEEAQEGVSAFFEKRKPNWG